MVTGMSDWESTRSSGGCSSPEISQRLAAYCFEDLSESERRLFEAHLLDCDFCWTEVQRLSAAVQIMRSDKEILRNLSVTDVSAVLGISAKLDWFFGGHVAHVLIASALYALGYTLVLFIEVAYALDKMAPMTLILAPAIFLWTFVTAILGLAFDWKVSLAGHRTGLFISAGVFTAAAIILYAAVCWFLPAAPITQLRIQAYTAQAAYFKGIRYLLPLGVVFMAVPSHFVVVMQRELREGRHRLALGLLSGEKWAVSPPGAFHISVRTLWILLLAAVLISIPMTAHLLDNLIPGPYMNVFINLLQARWVLYFGLGLECLAWYSRALNELKRECVAVEMAST
jgi:hypothetical protein